MDKQNYSVIELILIISNESFTMDSQFKYHPKMIANRSIEIIKR